MSITLIVVMYLLIGFIAVVIGKTIDKYGNYQVETNMLVFLWPVGALIAAICYMGALAEFISGKITAMIYRGKQLKFAREQALKDAAEK